MHLGPFEIIVILVIAVLIFGSRLPEVGREVGRALTEFKRGLRDMRDSTGIDESVRDFRNFRNDARRIARSEYDPFGSKDFHSPSETTEAGVVDSPTAPEDELAKGIEEPASPPGDSQNAAHRGQGEEAQEPEAGESERSRAREERD